MFQIFSFQRIEKTQQFEMKKKRNKRNYFLKKKIEFKLTT